MKSFLLKNTKPIISWSRVPDGIFFEGLLPGDEYDLAVCPTNEKMVIVDIDCKEGKVNGYDHIPSDILEELLRSYNYETKSGGRHIFLHYTGDKLLKNCSTEYGIDLRIGANKETRNAGGFVVYYEARQGKDIRDYIHLIKETSKELNLFLEKLFS